MIKWSFSKLLSGLLLICSSVVKAEASSVYSGNIERNMCSTFTHTDESRVVVSKLKLYLDQAESFRQNSFYNFLPEVKCEESNNYLETESSSFDLSSQPFAETELSPLCTYASLKHDTGKKYQKSCNNGTPVFTDEKPCLSKNYHKLVHNQITTAAECFKLDPKVLYSLFATESSLQVNIKPSESHSADGIGQLMPQEAVKELNKVVDSKTSENRYMRYLRHFKNNSSSNKCQKYFTQLEELELRGEDPKVCSETKNIEQKVSQDIYYTIAYMLLSAQTSIGLMLDDGFLFEQDYSNFLQKVGYTTKNVNRCSKITNVKKKNECLKTNTTLAVQTYFRSSNKLLNSAIEDLGENIYKNPIGPNNINKKIEFYFSSVKDGGINNKKSKLTKVLNHPFVKKYCNIGPVPQVGDYQVDGKSKKNSDILFTKDISGILSEIKACKRELSLGYIDVFSSMDDGKKIINEVNFYHHNGGQHLNALFSNYLSTKFIQGMNPKKMSYDDFTGDGEGSFKAHIIELEGHTQASNFVYNTPKPDSGEKAPGRDSSTKLILNETIKGQLNKIRNDAFTSGNLSYEQQEYLDYINTPEGFNKLCSQY